MTVVKWSYGIVPCKRATVIPYRYRTIILNLLCAKTAVLVELYSAAAYHRGGTHDCVSLAASFGFAMYILAVSTVFRRFSDRARCRMNCTPKREWKKMGPSKKGRTKMRQQTNFGWSAAL